MIRALIALGARTIGSTIVFPSLNEAMATR